MAWSEKYKKSINCDKPKGFSQKAHCASKKMASGGMTMKPVDKEANPGLAKLPEDVRNKMGYMKKGGSTKKFIQEAIKKPGALRKSLGVKEGEKIPAGKLAKAAKAPGKMGQRARLAQTLSKLKK